MVSIRSVMFLCVHIYIVCVYIVGVYITLQVFTLQAFTLQAFTLHIASVFIASVYIVRVDINTSILSCLTILQFSSYANHLFSFPSIDFSVAVASFLVFTTMNVLTCRRFTACEMAEDFHMYGLWGDRIHGGHKHAFTLQKSIHLMIGLDE